MGEVQVVVDLDGMLREEEEVQLLQMQMVEMGGLMQVVVEKEMVEMEVILGGYGTNNNGQPGQNPGGGGGGKRIGGTSGSGANGRVIVTWTVSCTAGTASSTPTLCINTALTPITHATTVATGIGTATGLPAGVTASCAQIHDHD